MPKSRKKLEEGQKPLPLPLPSSIPLDPCLRRSYTNRQFMPATVDAMIYPAFVEINMPRLSSRSLGIGDPVGWVECSVTHHPDNPANVVGGLRYHDEHTPL